MPMIPTTHDDAVGNQNRQRSTSRIDALGFDLRHDLDALPMLSRLPGEFTSGDGDRMLTAFHVQALAEN